MFTTDSLLALQ